jgi:hypothetical protein
VKKIEATFIKKPTIVGRNSYYRRAQCLAPPRQSMGIDMFRTADEMEEEQQRGELLKKRLHALAVSTWIN